MTSLRAGSATIDITPDWDLPLAGFGLREGPSQGVGHPLRLRVTVLESEHEGETRRAVIASVDLLWWGAEYVPMFRDMLAEIAGTTPELVLLTASHTHSGPQTSDRPARLIGSLDPRFHDLLVERASQVTATATSRLEPVTLTRHVGTHDLAFNRRYRFKVDGPVDRTLTVLRLARADGGTHTLFVHYTCHPTIHQGDAITAEYCGVAMQRLEETPGLTAHFLQGCAGDINADVNRDGTQERGGLDVVAREGDLLARAVQGLLATPGESLAPAPLAVAERDLPLPYAFVPTEAALREGLDAPGVLGEWRQLLLAHPEWRAPTIPLHLQRLDLARGCSLLAMDGEICVEYGLHVREVSGGAVLPMGYSNGMTGYVPTARIIAEGGYEAGESIPWFSLPAPFSPDVEPALMGALEELAHAQQGDPQP